MLHRTASSSRRGRKSTAPFLGATEEGVRRREGTLVVHVPSPAIGDVALVRVEAPGATGSFDGQPLHFVSSGEESLALAGVDLEHPPGKVSLVVAAGGREVVRDVVIRPRTFPEERLTVSKSYTDLDEATMARVEREQKRLEALWATTPSERQWHGRFARPADGPAGSPFGLRRFFNGQPKSPHAGIDFRSPEGAPVRASNRGRVVLADELFFTGNTIVVDHGIGVFTLYIHLSRIEAGIGATVERGQEIGKVGATGRVTGPHLHFAVRLGLARVDPATLLALRLPD